MALRVFEDTFGRRKVTRGKVIRSKSYTQEDYLRAVAEAVQSVVDTFRDPLTGDRYLVTTGPAAEAYTKPGEKAIRVSHKPLFDKRLRIATACTVMTGFTLHEVGHTLYTFPYLPQYKAAFGDPDKARGYYDQHAGQYDKLAWTVLNIGDDALLENRFASRFPIARDCFPTMLHWVALHTGMMGNIITWDQGPTKQATTNRVNFIIFATRYPWTAVWSPDAITRAERAFWQDWSRRYIATDDADAAARIELTNEALARLRSPEREEPPVEQPPNGNEPPPITCGPTMPIPKGEDDEDGETPSTDPGSDFEDDESDEDEDEDGDERGGTKSGSDEDEDEDEDDPRGWGEDEDDEDYDEDDEDEDEPAPKGDGKSGDEPTEEEDETPKPETGDETVPEGPKKFPEDFDAHSIRDIDTTVRGDEYNTTAEGRMVQKMLNEDRRNERTDVGVWGKATITITDLN